MSETKRGEHTPGPWHVQGYDEAGKCWGVCATVGAKSNTSTLIALVQYPQRTIEHPEGPDQVEANARLIAAAPRMFEAFGIAIARLEEGARIMTGTADTFNRHGKILPRDSMNDCAVRFRQYANEARAILAEIETGKGGQ